MAALSPSVLANASATVHVADEINDGSTDVPAAQFRPQRSAQEISVDRSAPLIRALGLHRVTTGAEYDAILRSLNERFKIIASSIEGVNGRIDGTGFMNAVKLESQKFQKASGEDAIQEDDAVSVDTISKDAFAYMDPSNFGTIAFTDVTSFLLDCAVFRAIQRTMKEALPLWTLRPNKLKTSSTRPRRLKRIPNRSQIVILDCAGSVYTFDEEKKSTKKLQLSQNLADALDAEYVESEYGYAVSTAAGYLVFYDSHFHVYDSVKVEENIQLLSWNHRYNVLCGANRVGSLTVWTIERKSQYQRLRLPYLQFEWPLHTRAASNMVTHLRSGLVCVGFIDGTVVIIHPLTGRKERSLQTATRNINSLSISETCNVVLIGTNDTRAEVWALHEAEGPTPFYLESRVRPHESPIVSVVCFPASSQAFTLDFQGLVKSWDLSTLFALQTFQLRQDDPKISWQCLTASGGTYESVYVCDRKSVRMLQTTQLARGEMSQVRPPASFVCHIPNLSSVVSVGSPRWTCWDAVTGEVLADANISTDGVEFSAVCSDTNSSQLFCGTTCGQVWVLNSATASATAKYRDAHVGSSVAAICFIDHANFAISIGTDGSGYILSPSNSVKVHAAEMQSIGLLGMRGQPTLSGMDGGVAYYVSCRHGKFFVCCTQHMEIRIHSCGDVAETFAMALHSSIVLPVATRLPQHVHPPNSSAPEFVARGRSIVGLQQVARTPYLLVADNVSFSVVEVFLMTEPALLCQHNIDAMFDSPICCLALHEPCNGEYLLFLGLESGLLLQLSVSQLIATRGQAMPVNLRSIMFPSSIMTVSLMLRDEGTINSDEECRYDDKIIVALSDGFIDVFDAINMRLIWSGNQQTSVHPKVTDYSARKWATLPRYSFERRDSPSPSRSSSPSRYGPAVRIASLPTRNISSPIRNTFSPTRGTGVSFPSVNEIAQSGLAGVVSVSNFEREETSQIAVRNSFVQKKLSLATHTFIHEKQRLDQQSTANLGSHPAETGQWVLSQLRSLCDEFVEYDESKNPNMRKEAVLFTTPLGIRVYRGEDPFSDCEAVAGEPLSVAPKTLGSSNSWVRQSFTAAVVTPSLDIRDRFSGKRPPLSSASDLKSNNMSTPPRQTTKMEFTHIPNLVSLREIEQERERKQSALRSMSLLRPMSGLSPGVPVRVSATGLSPASDVLFVPYHLSPSPSPDNKPFAICSRPLSSAATQTNTITQAESQRRTSRPPSGLGSPFPEGGLSFNISSHMPPRPESTPSKVFADIQQRDFVSPSTSLRSPNATLKRLSADKIVHLPSWLQTQTPKRK